MRNRLLPVCGTNLYQVLAGSRDQLLCMTVTYLSHSHKKEENPPGTETKEKRNTKKLAEPIAS